MSPIYLALDVCADQIDHCVISLFYCCFLQFTVSVHLFLHTLISYWAKHEFLRKIIFFHNYFTSNSFVFHASFSFCYSHIELYRISACLLCHTLVCELNIILCIYVELWEKRYIKFWSKKANLSTLALMLDLPQVPAHSPQHPCCWNHASHRWHFLVLAVMQYCWQVCDY